MLKNFIYYILIFTLFISKSAFAGISLIRDVETEKFLREISTPIFDAANLEKKNIKIYIVNDNSINAFVSGGQNVFVNTGLIRKYNTPDALIGVIAHETGHIAAGHLARSYEGAEKAEGLMLLSYLLGIAAAVGGSPDAAQGLIVGGSQSAERIFMKFTRGQEEAADTHAITYLDKIQYPADGLIELLESFEAEMRAYKGQIDEYLLSHPVSRKRIELIKNRTAHKHFSDKKINQKLQKSMDFILAKFEGYMDDPAQILQKYSDKNDPLSNYKKAIALFRKGKIQESISLLDQVIAANPKNGFLYEVKGQILFESGNIADSAVAYNKAMKLLDNREAALIKVYFSSAILALKNNDSDLANLAIKRLKEAQEFEGDNPFLFKELATAYSKIKDEGRSLLALAEYNLLIGQDDKTKKYANEAKDKLDKNDKINLLYADDLIAMAKDEKEKKEK
jgi:predicted Zn-dependent protease